MKDVARSEPGAPILEPITRKRSRWRRWLWLAAGVSALALVAALVWWLIPSDVWVGEADPPFDERIQVRRVQMQDSPSAGASFFDPIIETKDGGRYPVLMATDRSRLAYRKHNEWRDGKEGKPITATFAVARGSLGKDEIDVVDLEAGRLLSRAQLRAGASADEGLKVVTANRGNLVNWRKLVQKGPIQSIALYQERVIYSADPKGLRITVVGYIAASAVIRFSFRAGSVEPALTTLAKDPRLDPFGKVRDGWITPGALSTRIVGDDGHAIESATYPFSPTARKRTERP
jgi:hypothetical protein